MLFSTPKIFESSNGARASLESHFVFTLILGSLSFWIRSHFGFALILDSLSFWIHSHSGFALIFTVTGYRLCQISVCNNPSCV
jgi:hypothetical protein